jgi:hypothetical protein
MTAALVLVAVLATLAGLLLLLAGLLATAALLLIRLRIARLLIRVLIGVLIHGFSLKCRGFVPQLRLTRKAREGFLASFNAPDWSVELQLKLRRQSGSIRAGAGG